MIWIGTGLFLLLAAPAVAAFVYSMPREPLSLALSLGSLLLYVGAVAWLATRIGSRAWRGIFLFLGAGMMLVYQCAYFLSNYFLGEGFGESFFYHMSLNAIAEGWRAYPGVSVVFALSLIPLLGMVWLAVRAPVSRSRRVLPALAVMILALLIDPELRRLSLMAAQYGQSSRPVSMDEVEWEELGLDRSALNSRPRGVEPGRNLLLLYMEGLEQIYTDEEVFPGLTPNLDRLAGKGLQFRDIRQTSGTEWTVGGMVASLCGTPLLSEGGLAGNSILFARFLDRATCMSDVLEAAGYTQQFMGGASTEFAGKGPFLEAHGYDRVLGREQLLASLEDPAYRSGWGLYDDSMFEHASEEFRRLAEEETPFNLTLLTLDTHHPTGFPSDSCPSYEPVDNSMLDAVHCSDHLIGRFLDEISGHPAYEDTVVVLLSDHLGMRHNAYPLFPDDYPRRLFFTVLNTPESGKVDTVGTTMDVAPTLLELMDVEHEVGFVAGRSLLDSELDSRTTAFNDPRRLRALRSINSSVFSTRMEDSGVCERPILLSGVSGNALSLGSRSIPLVDGGVPIESERFMEDYVVAASFDRERDLQGSVVAPAEEWEQQLRSLPMGVMLLVGRHSHIASMVSLPETDIGEDRILVALGRRGQQFSILGDAARPAGLRVGPASCEQRFSELGL